MEPVRQAKLHIQKSNSGDITYLRFDGAIDEDFDGNQLQRGLGAKLIVSLRDIKRITSFGIRQWLEFINGASETCSAIYLVECTPRVVDQLNMVAGFAGKGQVISFYAPFRCDHCGQETNRLFQVDQDFARIRQGRLEGDTCSNDGTQTSFDDDPEAYLSYLATQPPIDVDPSVAGFLATQSAYATPEGVQRIRVEKKMRTSRSRRSPRGSRATSSLTWPQSPIARAKELPAGGSSWHRLPRTWSVSSSLACLHRCSKDSCGMRIWRRRGKS
jgi:hypothetical protein